MIKANSLIGVLSGDFKKGDKISVFYYDYEKEIKKILKKYGSVG